MIRNLMMKSGLPKMGLRLQAEKVAMKGGRANTYVTGNKPFNNICVGFGQSGLTYPSGQNKVMLMQYVRQTYSTKARYASSDVSAKEEQPLRTVSYSDDTLRSSQTETACAAMDLSVYDALAQISIEERFAQR